MATATSATQAIRRTPEIVVPIKARRLRVFTWITASLVALGTYLPQSIQGLIMSAFILTAVDTVTGFMISRRKGNTRSGNMRRMTAEKAGQFLTILALGAAGSVGARHWAPFGLAVSAIIAIEATSNIENLAWLETHGGAPLGPARPFLMKIAQVLGLTPDTQQEVPAIQEKEAEETA